MGSHSPDSPSDIEQLPEELVVRPLQSSDAAATLKKYDEDRLSKPEDIVDVASSMLPINKTIESYENENAKGGNEFLELIEDENVISLGCFRGDELVGFYFLRPLFPSDQSVKQVLEGIFGQVELLDQSEQVAIATAQRAITNNLFYEIVEIHSSGDRAVLDALEKEAQDSIPENAVLVAKVLSNITVSSTHTSRVLNSEQGNWRAVWRVVRGRMQRIGGSTNPEREIHPSRRKVREKFPEACPFSSIGATVPLGLTSAFQIFTGSSKAYFDTQRMLLREVEEEKKDDSVARRAYIAIAIGLTVAAVAVGYRFYFSKEAEEGEKVAELVDALKLALQRDDIKMFDPEAFNALLEKGDTEELQAYLRGTVFHLTPKQHRAQGKRNMCLVVEGDIPHSTFFAYKKTRGGIVVAGYSHLPGNTPPTYFAVTRDDHAQCEAFPVSEMSEVDSNEPFSQFIQKYGKSLLSLLTQPTHVESDRIDTIAEHLVSSRIIPAEQKLSWVQYHKRGFHVGAGNPKNSDKFVRGVLLSFIEAYVEHME